MQINISSVPPVAWSVGCFLICAGGGAYYWFGSGAATKRKTFPWFMGARGALWVGAEWVGLQVPARDFLLIAALTGVLAILNIAKVTFCTRCARMIDRGLLFRRVRSCPRCGAPLVSSQSRSADQ